MFNSSNSKRFNILVRTSNRPNYFRACYNSIKSQTYKNYKVLVSSDNSETTNYLKGYRNIKIIKVTKPNPENYPAPEIPRGKNLVKFPFNLYLNEMMKYVKDGYIIFLDDDDMFTNKTSLQKIADHFSGEDELLFWRVQFPDGKLIPEDDYFGKPPVFWHISGIGFAFHSKYIPNAQWDGWKGGDYVTATKLYNSVQKKIYINKALTGLQRQTGLGGFGKNDDRQPE